MDTELVKTLVAHFYDDQKTRVILLGFIPYMIYHTSILTIFMGAWSSEGSGLIDFTFMTATVYGIAVSATAYFAILEILQVNKLRSRYIALDNIIDADS